MIVPHKQISSVFVAAQFAFVILLVTAPLSRVLAAETKDIVFPDDPPQELKGYRLKNYRTVVPLTLKGATVVSHKRAMSLYKTGDVIFIDVMPFVPKPPNLPKGMIWRDKVHHHIKGSLWLANVGYGRLPDEMDRFFKDHLSRLSKGEKSQAFLFYCQANCWMSWNAAKRALSYGYSTVYWFPDGTDGWKKGGGQLIKATPEALPDMTRKIKTKR